MLTIYTKNDCFYCDQAKSLLTSKGITFVEINLVDDQEAYKFIISEGHRTVPQIYENGKLKFPNGYKDLINADESVFQQLRESQDAN